MFGVLRQRILFFFFAVIGISLSTAAFSTCPTPVALQETRQTFNSIWLSFPAVSGATGYQLDWKVATASTWTSVSLVTTASNLVEYNLAALTYQATYQWRVRTACADGLSAYSATRTFTVSCPVPDSLYEAVSPTAALLYWSAAPGLHQFTLNWRPVGTSIWNSVADIASSPFSLTGLTPSTNYEWQLVSQCADGTLSNATVPRSFTSTCSVPTELGVSYVTASAAYVYWRQLLGTNIQFQARYRPAGSNQNWLETTSTPNSFISFTGLVNGATYEWGVQTLCSGVPSGYVNGAPFTTGCYTPKYVNVPQITATSAIFTWGNYGNGVQYELQWRPSGQSTWNSRSVAGSTYTLTDLTQGTSYDYRLRTVCEEGSNSAFTTTNSFQTQSAGGNCTNIDSYREIDQTGTAVVLAFGVSGAISANVRWREDGNPVWNSLTVVTPYTRNGTETVFASLTGLTVGAAYEWQVQAVCSQTATSSYTPIRSFTTSCEAVSYQYEQALSLSQIGLWWRAIGGIAYRVQWRPYSTNPVDWTTISVNAISATGMNSVVVANLQSGTRYEWRIQTLCSVTNASVYTSPRSFSTACASPNFVSKLAVTSGAAKIGWDMPIGWIAPSTPQFRVRWRPETGGDWTESTLVSGFDYTIQPLLKTGYDVQVQQVCNGQPGDPTSTILLPYCWAPGPGYPYGNIPSPQSSAVSANTASLSWYEFGLGARYDVQWRVQGATTWPNSTTAAVGGLVLTGLAPGTTYEWRVRTLCIDNGVSDFTATYNFTTTDCAVLRTVKNGAWLDPSVWSCNRIPTSVDSVEIAHRLTVEGTQTAVAKQIQYKSEGKVSMSLGAKLQLSQQ
ncbi:peptidase domain protein [Fibrella aestuarina BUZ 2]|uniref:Peptidase domain protein n=1 Tax=Fibrella aestuarina BUZ 2 TaxID=1166018 RepID=I0KDQ5_9BACT|nr:fibronectin type III domain-containing protein [Fibrella aestuarina]CCH02258.1 peptidase domain protein [Fibrella aestuarina BUZ 2]